ncbi:MAG: type IV pilus assembly protein PilM [Acidobacteria bacterium]|nr:type IV pilus assembly protein PilM [Acidobacteriota bacterium]
MFGRSKGLVGLDIGSSAVKAVELKASGRSFRVAAFASESMAPDSIVDGAIIDGAGVADAIRRVLERAGTRTRDVAASLSGNAVIVKKISLPQMTSTELAESIRWEAEQYIPFDVQDVNLDYQILPGADTKNTMDVLLVAAKKEKIADYTGVITQAGRVPVVVDVDAFALQNAFEANYDIEPGVVTVLMNVGASAVNINIVAGTASLFTRDMSVGGNAYTEAVQREFNLTFERAEQAKRGDSAESVRPEDIAPVLRAVSENVLLEIQKTFDFYKATAPSDRLDRVMLCGGGSNVPGFAEALAERFGLPVERLDPFRRITFDAAKSGVRADEAAPTAVVAVGLALRRAGDR